LGLSKGDFGRNRGTMSAIPQQREIIDRRELSAKLDALAEAEGGHTARPAVLAALKAALKTGRDEVRTRFEAGWSGRETLRALAFLDDQLIRTLYDFAFRHVYPLANPTAAEHQAIVAVGGYGRGELAPFSDLDLLFLRAYKLTPHTEQIIEYMLYMLWDLGLKVGHATRSVDECIRMARNDHTVRTALLESRFLWGEQSLYNEMRRRFLADAATSDVEFVEAKLGERDERHRKLGDSRYVLEPNIKDGKGGLRDLHTLYWIAKYIYRVDDVGDLVDRGVFTAREAADFEKARDFLSTVRCHLHYLADRAEDRLTFDLQPEIARRLSYTDHAGTRGVERFMKHYYLVAKEVGDLTRIFCAALEAEHKRRPRFRLNMFSARDKSLEGFVVADGGWLKVASDSAFTDDPVNFLRLFHVAQEHDLDVHPATLRLITQNIKAIKAPMRRNPEANRLFLEMLTSRKNPETALKRLNEAGVLGRFIPDFGRVVAQMQYDMYHVYTVDEHAIRAIGLLHAIETGALKEDHPVSVEVVHKVQSRRALYLAVLLHDIAKGRGGDHSKLGAEVAQKLGPRLGLSDEETDTVAWLVLHHLAMSNTAQRRDIDDPKTIADFVALVQSPERLRLLLVLTVVDMRATGPHVWNGWKAALLRELYWRTEEVMSGSASGGSKSRVAHAQAALKEKLTGWSPEEIEAHLARGYPSYWLSLDTDTLARHAELARAAEREQRAIMINHRIDTWRAITEVTIYTADHPGLFSQIAGAMALSGASIVDAKIYTMTNGKALDIFWIQDAEHGAFDERERLERLDKRIEEALTGRLRPWRELARREALPDRARVFTVPPRVLIDNTASATHTVIEVNGRDRPGLLYDVTRALTDLGLQISTAKISTFGERVVDVFYVKDIFGVKVEHQRKIDDIRLRLYDSLADPRERGAATAAPKRSAAGAE
jgi:[protein-PII] uridylyltransferase